MLFRRPLRGEARDMSIDRRNFAALAAAGVFCLGARKVFASPIVQLAELEETGRGFDVALRPAPPAIVGRFPISIEDYSKVETEYLPQLVTYVTAEPPGTIIVDTDNRHLYLILGSSQARRYGIGVGRDGFGWSGTATVQRKIKWPMWFPPKQMQYRDREARKWRRGMPGGPRNPLGARALYLFQGKADTLFRIHGTRDPKSIGHAVSSGCIRMLNADIIDLFDNVPLGTTVIVLPSSRPVAQANGKSRAKMAYAGRRRKRIRTAFYSRRRRFRSILSMFGF
jgi:lipoprotein-anchoring transpeptidase ErfK/SrfK